MKKLTPFIVSLVIVFSSVAPVFAQVRSPAASTPGKELRQELPGKTQEAKKSPGEEKMGIITQYFEKMTKRLDAALEREKKLMDRVESRIKKFEEKGAHVDAAKKNLSDARVAWQRAKDALYEAKTKFESLKASNNPKTAFQDVKKLVIDAVSLIKKTHAAVVKTIMSLKGASSGVKEQGKPEAVSPAGGTTTAPRPVE